MSYTIKINNKSSSWDDLKVQNTLNQIVNSHSKKTKWIKAHLDVTQPNLIARAIFVILGKIKFLRNKFFKIDEDLSSHILRQLKIQIEAKNDPRMMALFDAAVIRAVCINKRIHVAPINNPHVVVVQRSGLRNTGNSCYIISVLQNIAHHRFYRKAFNPRENPLVIKSGESENTFEERKQIQNQIHQIVNKIVRGEPGIDIQSVCRKIGEFQGVCEFASGRSDIALNDVLFDKVLCLNTGYRVPIENWDTDAALTAEERASLEASFEIDNSDMHLCEISVSPSQESLQNLFRYQWLTGGRVMERQDVDRADPARYINATLTRRFESNDNEEPLIVKIVRAVPNMRYDIPQQWQPTPEAPAYRLESVLIRAPGHATALIKGSNGKFVHFDDDQVRELEDRDALEMINRYGESCFYKNVATS